MKKAYSEKRLFSLDESYDSYIFGAKLLTNYAKRFNKNVDEKNLRNLMELYLIFVKAVDRETDSGEKTMGYYCSLLENFNGKIQKDKLGFLIFDFCKAANLIKKDIVNFRVVAKYAYKVANSKNVKDYLFYREKVTNVLGIIGIRIVKKFINNEEFNSFSIKLLNCSDLLDIVLDIKEDKRRGEIKFKIGLFGYFRIYIKLIKNLLSLFFHYPFMIKDTFVFSKKLNRVKF